MADANTTKRLSTPQLRLLRSLIRKPRNITGREIETLRVLMEQGLVVDNGRTFEATDAGYKRGR